MTQVQDRTLELWQDHISSPSERTLEGLVLHYQPLAKLLARRAKMKAPPHQPFDELLSFAYRGLLDAIEKFDYGRGIQFDTYATRRISGAIVDGQRDLDPLTRRERKAVREFEAGYELLELAHGRRPTLEELAEELGTGVDDVRRRMLMQKSLAVGFERSSGLQGGSSYNDGNWRNGGKENSSVPEMVEDETHVEIGLRRSELAVALAMRLPRLGERERALVILFYVEGLSYQEIGERLGLRENRCREIRKAALRELVA